MGRSRWATRTVREAFLGVLQVISNRPGAGKTCLIGALTCRLTAAGKSVAYYKPLSPEAEADPDTAFMAQLLPETPEPVPPPIASPLSEPRLSEGQRREIADAVARLDAAFDTVLVEWSFPNAPEETSSGESTPGESTPGESTPGESAPGELTPGDQAIAGAGELLAGQFLAPGILAGQPSLLLFGYSGGGDAGTEAARIAAAAKSLGADLAGVIINGVTRHRRMAVEQQVVSVLRSAGTPVLGAIPEDREMLALTVRQVAEFLGGRWIQEPEDAAAWVDRFLIGGNIMDSGPNYFGRYPNQAVITRSGRPDIQMACLTSDTKCLVLTGGEEPTEYIRVEARQRSASVLLVPGSTLEVAESLAGLLEQANPYSEQKLSRFAALMERHLDSLPDLWPGRSIAAAQA